MTSSGACSGVLRADAGRDPEGVGGLESVLAEPRRVKFESKSRTNPD